ncbi:MAG: cobalamin-binding protein [Lentisphaerae bacterium]|nr:cobalamin-binding protein [Lentisphaerota bacterium]
MKRLLAYCGLVALLVATGCRPAHQPTPTGPLRIVSLAPSLTESLCAIGAGDLLVGRTSACNYPPDITATIPIIGGFGHPSLELLAAARPTLVLDVDLIDEGITTQIRSLGIPHRRIACDSLDDIAPMLRELGDITGHQAEAEVLAQELTRTINTARAEITTPLAYRPSVYAEVWHDPLTTIGRDTFLAGLVALAGGRTIAASVDKPYFQIAPESILSENPDLILCLYMGPSQGAVEAVKARPGWQHINAVRNDCIFADLDNDVLLRPGPRLIEGLQALRACIANVPGGQMP